MSSWKEKLLSLGGRWVLINSVLTNISILLPITKRSLATIGLFPIKIILARISEKN
jgi:hypothetical protein